MDKIKKKNKCDADFRLVIVTGLLDRDQLHNVMLLLLLLSIDSETNFRKINFSLFLYPIVSCANITLGGDFSVRDRAEEEEKRPHSPPSHHHRWDIEPSAAIWYALHGNHSLQQITRMLLVSMQERMGFLPSSSNHSWWPQQNWLIPCNN